MFNKFADIEDQKERLEIYNLLKFNLSLCLRLAELMTLVILISGLGWFISTETARLLGPDLAPRLAAPLAIFLMILIPALFRLPFLLAVGRLRAAFKLDPRSEAARLKHFAQTGLRRLLFIWLISLGLYLALGQLPLWQWTVLALGLGALLVAVNSYFPRLMSPETLRPLREGDLSPALLAQIENWKSKTGLSVKDILISTSFSPELAFPKLLGLGREKRLVIQEKALAFFPPRELSIMAVIGVMDSLVRGPLKFMLLRFCSLAVTVPLASILISTVGVSFWGYPAISSPALITLVWLAAWLGLNISDFTIRFTGRSMTSQLAAAASLLLKDETSLETALSTIAHKNLEDESPSPWREVFRRQYSRPVFLKKVRYHQHMSKFAE